MAYVMNQGGVRLRVWLKKRGLTQTDLAEKIAPLVREERRSAACQTNVSAWILGRTIPLDMAVAIERVTKIPVEDWTVPAEESARRVQC